MMHTSQLDNDGTKDTYQASFVHGWLWNVFKVLRRVNARYFLALQCRGVSLGERVDVIPWLRVVHLDQSGRFA